MPAAKWDQPQLRACTQTDGATGAHRYDAGAPEP